MRTLGSPFSIRRSVGIEMPTCLAINIIGKRRSKRARFSALPRSLIFVVGVVLSGAGITEHKTFVNGTKVISVATYHKGGRGRINSRACILPTLPSVATNIVRGQFYAHGVLVCAAASRQISFSGLNSALFAPVVMDLK